jgi:catechol 2,3-dioxygenase-like lactoylglutathione lyase family enzyme
VPESAGATPVGEPMTQRLFLTAVMVRDYDEAIAFYVGVLDFEIRIDERLSDTKRWVVLAPQGGGQGCILLARPETDRQSHFIGNQTGGRVFLFLDTDDFARDFAAYTARGVTFVEPPRIEKYGTVAVFEDLYGNRWDLIEHTGYFGLNS